MIIINDENDHIKIFLNQNSLSKIQQQQIQIRTTNKLEFYYIIASNRFI